MAIAGQQGIDAVRRVFPRASDDEAWGMLWSHTGWPGFFHTDDHGREIVKSLRKLKETLNKERSPCDFCNGPAMRKGTLCVDCERMWSRCMAEMRE